ncbi:shikimate dehydrogenase [bacterium]|nr:shikimate dehydrogenase [bacterium]
MICVSIGRTRHKMVVAEHRHLAEKGAQLIELRLDWLGRMPDLRRLLKKKPTPVVVTCRRLQDKGRWKWTEEQRMSVLREAIVSGSVDYVDLEEDIAGKVPRFGDTKRIVSYHNFEETPLHIQDIYEDICTKDPDIVKIATMANSPEDNVRMLELVARAEKPTIGFCMGDLGTMSRVLCGKFGSPFTYASFSSERKLAPGQLSFKEMRHMYRFNHIAKDTKVFGVLGDPIGHSLSPLLHNAAFQHRKIDAVYVPMRVPENVFHESLEAFDRIGISGYSVTIPNKLEALEFADDADEATTEIGAANTLVKRDDGSWFASNTDYDAAIETVQLLLDTQKDELQRTIQNRQILILGAGGVARAIGLAMIRLGGIVTITNRTTERAQLLATELECQTVTWENRGSVFAEVVINCTPIGMHPEVNKTPFNEVWLRESALVFDTIYNPENTLFIKNARKRGCETISGLEMFVRQAASQFEQFTGQEPPIDHLRDTLRFGISPGGK